MYTRVFVGLVFMLLSLASLAEGVALSGHISAQGGGIEVTTNIAHQLNARITYHEYRYQGTDPLPLLKQFGQLSTDLFGSTKSENAYDHNGNQQVLSAIFDWYPSEEGQTRLSIGLGYNKSHDNILGLEQIIGGYRLGDNLYTVGQVGKLSGSLDYSSFAPYFGFGWGNPVLKGKSWGFVSDIGFLYEGPPQVSLNATGTDVSPADLQAERDRLRKETWKWSLMLSIGASYQG